MPVAWDCKNNQVATDGYMYAIKDGVRYAVKDGVAMVKNTLRSVNAVDISAMVQIGETEYPVTSIGASAFYGCNSLTSITFEGTVEEWNAMGVDASTWDDCPATEIVCGDGTVAL